VGMLTQCLPESKDNVDRRDNKTFLASHVFAFHDQFCVGAQAKLILHGHRSKSSDSGEMLKSIQTPIPFPNSSLRVPGASPPALRPKIPNSQPSTRRESGQALNFKAETEGN
jgi:hypothetical protein